MGQPRRKRMFGEIAIELSFCSREQIEKGLRKQADEKGNGSERYIGSVMQELGHLSAWHVDKILSIQKEEERGLVDIAPE